MMIKHVATPPQTRYLRDYRPHPYVIDKVELLFDLYPDKTCVETVLTVRRRDPDTVSPLVLDGEQLELLEVEIDQQALSTDQYVVDAESLTIAAVPARFQLRTVVAINPAANTALEGLYISSGNFCTQCEAEGFRKITFYIDRPDNLAMFTTTLRASKIDYPILLSNGNCVDSGDMPENRHWVQWQDPFPKPCYLFALVAGQLVSMNDVFTTASGRQVDLHIYVEEHNRDKCDYAMQSLKNAMYWDEQVFGLEYDLDNYMIVAVDDFNMGAMENKGLNIFNSKFVLANAETATDSDYQNIESVIAHEYFHNWTGNRVTCRDWFQLSLKEGLTVFRDQQFSADMTNKAVKRIQDVRTLRTIQFAEDAGPMVHPIRPASYIEINNFYTATVYQKGAEVIRMQYELLGKEHFHKAMQLYFQRHDGQAVTCDDFVDAMQTAGQTDFSQFKRWYSQAGTPTLKISGDYNSEQQCYRLYVQQDLSTMVGDVEDMLIPLSIGLLALDGQEQLATQTLSIHQAQQTLEFTNIASKPIPSLLRGFSAPVNYQYDYSRDELALLACADTDSFARWEAMQRLSLQTLEQMMAQLQQGQSVTVPEDIGQVIDTLLTQVSDEYCAPAYAAELLSLPSERYIAEQMSVIQPELIYQAREQLMTQLARQHHDALRLVYDQFANSGCYSPDAVSVGQRSLRNQCLNWLMRLAIHNSKQDIIDLCVSQYRQANNMTDLMAALNGLSELNGALHDDIMQDFYQQYQHETLVIDKWFTVQALSHRENTLQDVQQLMQHSAFCIKNPNKVRALLGAFVMGNPLRFHHANGRAYQLLADVVLQLNTLNPQVASRMVCGFNQWRRYDSSRQVLMQRELKRILEYQALSPDVYEIISKALGDRKC